jgi:hypothetical protein
VLFLARILHDAAVMLPDGPWGAESQGVAMFCVHVDAPSVHLTVATSTSSDKPDVNGRSIFCADYFRTRLSAMTSKTRRWLVDRIDEVQSRAFAE